MLHMTFECICTGESLWVNIHPLHRVVSLLFQNHLDLIGTVCPRAEHKEKQDIRLHNKCNRLFIFTRQRDEKGRQMNKVLLLVWFGFCLSTKEPDGN